MLIEMTGEYSQLIFLDRYLADARSHVVRCERYVLVVNHVRNFEDIRTSSQRKKRSSLGRLRSRDLKTPSPRGECHHIDFRLNVSWSFNQPSTAGVQETVSVVTRHTQHFGPVSATGLRHVGFPSSTGIVLPHRHNLDRARAVVANIPRIVVDNSNRNAY